MITKTGIVTITQEQINITAFEFTNNAGRTEITQDEAGIEAIDWAIKCLQDRRALLKLLVAPDIIVPTGRKVIVPIDAARYVPPISRCPKCKQTSGDDWKQCNGSCPLQASPHYNPQASWSETDSDEPVNCGECDTAWSCYADSSKCLRKQ